MNLVGKIFTVLIFVMSITFMTMAIMVYATHKNWRDVVVASKTVTGLKPQLDTVKKENDDLKSQKEKLEKDLTDLQETKSNASWPSWKTKSR